MKAHRLFWLAALVGSVLVLGMAILLTPNPAGLGTHQQLGLPPCGFRVLLGIPCPGCGLTTSFAHFVRGEFAQSWAANPGGLLLASGTALAVPVALVALQRRWTATQVLLSRTFLTLLVLTAVTMAVGWVVRIA